MAANSSKEGDAATAADTAPLVHSAQPPAQLSKEQRMREIEIAQEKCNLELAMPEKVQCREKLACASTRHQYRKKCTQYRVRAGSSVAPVTPPDEDALAAVTAPIANVQHANPAITPIHQLSTRRASPTAVAEAELMAFRRKERSKECQAIQAANEAYWSAHSAEAGSEPPSPRPYLEACLTCGSHNCVCPGVDCHFAAAYVETVETQANETQLAVNAVIDVIDLAPPQTQPPDESEDFVHDGQLPDSSQNID